MALRLPEMPEAGWRQVVYWTTIATLAICALATLGSVYSVEVLNGKVTTADVITPLVLGPVLSIPFFGTLMIKIQQLRLANDRLQIHAMTDSLTGWLNRGAFTTQVETALARSNANGGDRPGALLVIDIDRFKSVNDSLGHQAGDAALHAITTVLRKQLREHDIFGRLGGEEFGVFLVDADHEIACEIAERCRAAVETLQFEADGETHPLSISIGVSPVRGLTSFEATYRDADRKLYHAKESGRNRVVVAMPPQRPNKPVATSALSEHAA